MAAIASAVVYHLCTFVITPYIETVGFGSELLETLWLAQWLEHSTRSQRVMGSNSLWDSDFSESTFLLEFT